MYTKPNIGLLNSELVLKAERNNAEVRLENVEEYPKVVEAEHPLRQAEQDLSPSGLRLSSPSCP